MSRNNGKSPQMGTTTRLRGGPSTRRADLHEELEEESPKRSSSSSSTSSSSTSSKSPASSCVSSEGEQNKQQTYASNSPEATSSMVLAGCPRCLMYVMLSEEDPKCPKCNSTVLLDFHHGNKTTTTKTTTKKS